VLAVELKGVGVAAVGDEGDVAGDVGVGRAGRHAGDVVGEPLGVAGEDRVALAGALGVGGVEGGVDEGEEADPTGVLDLDVEALAGDAMGGERAGGELDLGVGHGAEAVGRRPAGGAGVGRRDALVDPPADLAAEHGSRSSGRQPASPRGHTAGVRRQRQKAQSRRVYMG